MKSLDPSFLVHKLHSCFPNHKNGTISSAINPSDQLFLSPMDPNHIRCKDLKPNFPHAFDRLRQEQPSVDTCQALDAWLDDVQVALAHSMPPGRHPLRRIELNSHSHLRQPSVSSKNTHISQRLMAERPSQDVPKIARGQRRGRGRGRAARGLAILPVMSKKLKFPTLEEAEDDPSTQHISQEDNPFIDTSSALIQRPSNSDLPTQKSPTKSKPAKAGSAILKKEHLAFMNPSIEFIDHQLAKNRGGLPSVVKKLWMDYVSQALYRPDFIPSGLKV